MWLWMRRHARCLHCYVVRVPCHPLSTGYELKPSNIPSMQLSAEGHQTRQRLPTLRLWLRHAPLCAGRSIRCSTQGLPPPSRRAHRTDLVAPIRADPVYANFKHQDHAEFDGLTQSSAWSCGRGDDLHGCRCGFCTVVGKQRTYGARGSDVVLRLCLII